MFDRPLVFVPLVLVMCAGVIGVFASAHLHYGLQVASPIPYTAFVVLGTFSAQRGQRPYMFECPAVNRQLLRLAQRHAGFVAVVFFLQTVALQLRPHLPASWLVGGRDGSSFGIALSILCGCLASAQVWTNRSLLEQAHFESAAD